MNNTTEVSEVDPLGCFQVFAERKYNPGAKGYENMRGTFHSLSLAKSFALRLQADTDYYTGYSWVQVVDVNTGTVWNYNDEDGEWIASQWLSTQGAM